MSEQEIVQESPKDLPAPRLQQGTFGTNAAHQVLNQIGGHPLVMMMLGYYVDHTTMPKKLAKADRKKVHYGNTLMSHFDIKRKEAIKRQHDIDMAHYVETFGAIV